MKHLVTACLLFLLPVVSGQDRAPVYVPPGTDQIQKQIDAAKEGDVLILGKGNTYIESKTIIINKGLTIKGEGTAAFRSNDVIVHINDTSVIPDYPNTVIFVNGTWNVMLRDFTLLHVPSNKSCVFQEPFVSPQPSTRILFVTPDVVKKHSSLPPAPSSPPPGSLPPSGGTSSPGATTNPSSPGATTAPSSPGTTKARRQAPTPSTLPATTENAATTTTDFAQTDMETRPAFGAPETTVADGPGGGPGETAPVPGAGGTNAPPAGSTSAPGADPASAPGGTSAPPGEPGAPGGGGEGSGPVVLPPPGPSGFNNLTGGPYLVIRGTLGPWYNQRRLIDATVGNCSLSNKALSAPQMFIIMSPTYCVGHMGFAIEYEKANGCMNVVNGTGGITQFSHNITVNMTDTLRAYNASIDHIGEKVKQEERLQSNATTVFFEGAVNPADRTRSIIDVYWKVPGARAVIISLKKKPIAPQFASLAINLTLPAPYTVVPSPLTFNATLLTLPSGNQATTSGPMMWNSTEKECTGNGSCSFVVMFDVIGCQITGQYRFTLNPSCRPSAAGCKPPPTLGAIISLGSNPFCGAPISAQSSANTLIRSDSTYAIARTDNKFTYGNTAYFLVVLDTLNPDFIIQAAKLVSIDRTNIEDTCAGVTWELAHNTTAVNQTFNGNTYPPTLSFGIVMDKNASCAVAGKTKVTVNFKFDIEVTYEDGIYTGLPPMPGLVPGLSTQPATEPIPATTNQMGPTDATGQSTAPAAPTGTGPATSGPARRRREVTLGNIYANSTTEVTYTDGDLKSLDDLVNNILDSMGLGNATNTTTESSSGAAAGPTSTPAAASAPGSTGTETSATPTSTDSAAGASSTSGGGSNSTTGGNSKNSTAGGKTPPPTTPAAGGAAANASAGPVEFLVPATWGELEWKIIYATSTLLALACVWCCCTNCIACIWNSQTKHVKKTNKVVHKQRYPSQVAFMSQSSDEAALLAHRQSMGQVSQYGGNSQYF